MAQTPQQQRANKKYAQAAKNRNAPPITKPKQNPKPPISTGWIVLLAFVVCGGLLFELLRVVPEVWTFISSAFGR